MPGMPMMEAPAAPKGAALVSVDGRTYPLQSARIAAEASGGIVRSTLVQSYRNPYDEALEVVYTMPLPADGAVVGYTMRLGERIVRGEVRPRSQARAKYEKALFEGRSAALLEQDRDDTFSQRLGSLPARMDAEITIEVLHPLGFVAGSKAAPAQWEYRFPTVVSVRYQGQPGRVPDADRLDVDRAAAGEIPARIELTLDVTDRDGIEGHRVESMPLDRDLVVRWPAAQAEVGARLVEGPGLPGDSGRYGLITITPPAVPQVTFSRDLTILIDASGSMSGAPIEWAKRVTRELLAGLAAHDRLEVIAFANRPANLTGGCVPATAASVAAAISEVDALSAGGSTEMAAAIIAALRPLRAESQRQVVLITDGQIGMENEVVRGVRDGLPASSRLHVVGVGAAPNRTLTARASRAGRGIECFVCGDHQVDAATRSIIAATARPVLTDLRLESAALHGVVPGRPRDLMAGQPVTMAVELADGGGRIHVSGNLAGAAERWAWQIDVPPLEARKAASTVPIGALYGRETVADLEMSGREEADLVEKVAMRHRIVSSATSMVAIAEEPSVDPRQPRRLVELPVEVPAFQSAAALGLLGSARVALARRVESAARPYSSSDIYKLRGFESLLGHLPRASRKSPDTLRGRVIHAEGDLIVVEYETPADGFMGPQGEILVTDEKGRSEVATTDPAQSSPPGPHAKGVLLRVALRRIEGLALTMGAAVTLSFDA
jgi:Ca-activated chloride channel homolog